MKRILIISGGLHMGGAERVAANICVYAPKKEFEFHYLVFEGYDNIYGPEIEKLGGRIISVPPPSAGYTAYIRLLWKLLRNNRYSVVHSHTMFNSGINLAIAKLSGVPIRIAHSHTTRTETKVTVIQKLYEHFMRKLVLWSATDLLACGVEAGEWMFGRNAFAKLGRVIHNGINTDEFTFSDKNRLTIRQKYGFAKHDYVIGHSGSLIPLKNQEFLIRLLPKIQMKAPDAKLMLIGSGEEAELVRLQAIAAECNVADAVVFCGGVKNVHECLSAVDVFAFPSLREGTPLALIEAQANGLPCVISDRIPDDAILTDLVRPLSLDDKNAWTEALTIAERINPSLYAQKIEAAGYGLKTSYNPIYRIYEGEKRPKRQPVISLSFDDARGDNTAIFDSVLKTYALPVTLNVTTGYVDGSCPLSLRPSIKPAMTREDIIRMHASGSVEIAMHGDQHLNSISDMKACRTKLIDWLASSEETAFGFASPGSGLSISTFFSPEFSSIRSSVKYVRTSFRIRTKTFLRVLSRKAGRVIHLPLLYQIAYADTIMFFRDGKIIYSVPVMRDATLSQVKSLVKLCIREGGSLTLMFHSVLPDTSGEDNWTWSLKRFERLCAWLNEQRSLKTLEVLTTEKLFERMAH